MGESEKRRFAMGRIWRANRDPVEVSAGANLNRVGRDFRNSEAAGQFPGSLGPTAADYNHLGQRMAKQTRNMAGFGEGTRANHP